METVDYRTTKQKVQDARLKVKRKLREGWDWVKENKEIVIVAIPVVGTCVACTAKGISKFVNNHKAEEIKNKYIYDPALGFYWPMKRALTGSEKLELEERRRAGEPMGEILRSMGVLRK